MGNAPEDVAQRGDLIQVGRFATVAGILPAEARDVVLRLAYEHISERAKQSGMHALEPMVDFHLVGGATVNALHWRADDSVAGLTQSLGVVASLVYPGEQQEIDNS